ncbi:MAG TPA: glutathione peroxidase [Candidatus Hydrogenedentes bacterium]|jgi:glutathione peroxidase|nr:glutathione peroxidase [Candidatus Hydrogenedentota bacterium]HQN00892.1 glutathione peroxidase [Candidatus Hydrogenedentota bacterium]
MNKGLVLLWTPTVMIAVAGLAACGTEAKGEPVNILRHTMKDIESNDVNLSDYLGKVVLIVNVASKCGFTDQYASLEALYKKYKDQGFVILGFPSNDFLRQEPGTDQEIKAFCTLTYGVSFPMFSKIAVTGKNKAPLYKDLTEKVANPNFSGGIKWNFTKFLIGKDGTVVDRFAPTTKPDADKVIAAIEKALSVPDKDALEQPAQP